VTLTAGSPDPNSEVIERERRRLSQRLEEVARLCEADVNPPTFYGELLKRLLESMAAPAGAVWTRTTQGNLQLQFQVNLKEVGVDRSEEGRQAHEELLRLAVSKPQQFHLLPHSGAGPAQEGRAAPGNPTDYLLLMVPILLNDQVAGLLEVWQNPGRPMNAVPGFLQYMSLMAELGTRYQRNQMLGQMAGQQQVWTQLEDFSRKVHGSLNPIEVSYIVANEGRRLIECDRVSVAVRYGGRVSIDTVSGADVVEKRSNLVQLMRTLCDKVLTWGEKLVFIGTKDDSLPPPVLKALDEYLHESNSKLLVVQPLKDEREKDKTKPARSALLMECFEPPAEPQQLISRLDVVSKHATTALYNAVEHKRIPMRFLWLPLAKIQEGLGGKARAITLAVLVGVTLLISVLVLVPYPLKMEAKGDLLPEVRATLYSMTPGKVERFNVSPGETVAPNSQLVQLQDLQMGNKLATIAQEMVSAQRQAHVFETLMSDPSTPPEKKTEYQSSARDQRDLAEHKQTELATLMKNLEAKRGSDLGEGLMVIKAPSFSPEDAAKVTKQEWTVLNSNFHQELTGRNVQPSEPLLRLGAKSGPWLVELKIPQKHIGQVLLAMERPDTYRDANGVPILDVDFNLRSDPARKFKGKLSRDKVGGEANPSHDDTGEAEPVVVAYVRIDGDDIPEDDRVPRELLLSGTEVHAKVRCGKRAMGYALFYGVWEFFYDKVVFFF
jgi:hypothetical protein